MFYTFVGRRHYCMVVTILDKRAESSMIKIFGSIADYVSLDGEKH